MVALSQALLGKLLVTRFESHLTTGMIVETEAYRAPDDKACHAHLNRFTQRTQVMFAQGGTAYIYLCYGIHHLFNVVTNVEDKADAILIRAIQPIDGKKMMLQRRDMQNVNPSLTAGPGRLTQALGISTDLDGTVLTENSIWIEDRNIDFSTPSLIATKRVGVDYAGEDAKLPWRFYPQKSIWVSKK